MRVFIMLVWCVLVLCAALFCIAVLFNLPVKGMTHQNIHKQKTLWT